MQRILPAYIVRQHVGPFLFGLVVITFVLIMDMVVDYIDLFLGKGVPFGTVLEVFVLSLGWMLALSVPMAVLVASLMTYGRLAQDQEITAMKAGGLSFAQILGPTALAAVLLSGALLAYNDRVLPVANHRLATLFLDIHRKKPAIAIREGRFVNIQEHTIHVRRLDEKTSKMEEVTITRNRGSKDEQTIFARRGWMETSPDGGTLRLHLEDGEIHQVDENDPSRYNRIRFERHEIILTGIGSDLVRSEGKYKGDRELSIEEMEGRIRTIETDISGSRDGARGAIAEIAGRLLTRATSPPPDSIADPRGRRAELPRRDVADIAGQVDRWRRQETAKGRERARYEVEIQKKLAIPFACLLFVLVGGPLGIRVGRGGIGVGAGLSLVFFLVYYLFLLGGEELADRGLLSPIVAMWAANALLTVVAAGLITSLSRGGARGSGA